MHLSWCQVGLLCLLAATAAEATKPIRLRSSPSCPTGEKPLTIDGKPKKCEVTKNSTCPKDYDCLFEQNICCPEKKHNLQTSKTDSKYCGEDGRVFRDGHNKTTKCKKDKDCLPPTLCLDQGYCCLLRLDQEPPPVGCPFGSRPLKNANKQVITCTPGAPNACPGNALCYQDSVDGTYKCCGKDPGQGCPSGSKAVKTNNKIIPCTPGSTANSCPTGALCQWSYLIDRYQCCQSDNGCAENEKPLLNPNRQVTTCTMDGQQSCPTNFKCKFNFWTAIYQCCGRDLDGSRATECVYSRGHGFVCRKPASTKGLCPVGQIPYLDTRSGQVRQCAGFTCPSGYNCQQSNTGQSVCCGAQGICPNNLILVTDTQGRPSTCTLNGAVNCQAPATCMQASGGAPIHYLCCRTTTFPTTTCPSNRTPYPSAQNPQRCTRNLPGSCPYGTTCEISPTSNTAICCTGTNPVNSCPSGWVVQNGVSTFCSPTNPTTTCRFGSSCLQSTSVPNQYICCTPSALVQYQCPVGKPLLVGNAHKFCSFGVQCPTGSVCQTAVNKPSTSICCTVDTQQQYFCPSGTPYKLNNQYQFCTISTGCGTGYACMTSTSDTRIQLCCTVNDLATYTCPSGVPWYVSNRYQFCATNPSLCQSGYICQAPNENFNIKICCSSGSFVPVCPNNARPLILGTQYQYCTSNSGICQSGYSCVNAQNNPSIRVCCSTAASGTYVCPNNGLPFLVGSNVQLCTNNPGLCVLGYTCQAAFNDPTTSICCSSSSGTTSYTCPNNAIPYLIGNQYRICSSSPFVCGSGYACQAATNNPSVRICCSSTTGSYTCSNGGTPLQFGNQYQFCAANPSICGSIYSCVSALNNPGVQICCSKSSLYTCPSGSPLQIGGQFQFCTNNAAICTTGSICQTATNNANIRICCTSSQIYTCANGGSPYQVASQVQFCTNNAAVCISGYTCQTATNNPSVRICCTGSGSSPQYTCPSGGTPVVVTNRNQFCSTTNPNCPLGSSCRNAANQPTVTICCYGGTTNTPQCPRGTPYQVGGQYQYCSQTAPNCITGYTCQRASNLANTYVCCSGGTTTPQCPRGTPYQVNGQYSYCSQTAPNCITGYTCQRANNLANTFVCCSGTSSQYTCPNNQQTYIASNGQPIFCSITSPTNCPSTTTCQRAVNNQQYAICCKRPTSQNVCPSGQQVLLLTNGQPQFCTGPGGSCSRTGYTCQVSPTLGQFVCCGSGTAQCANGATIYQPTAGQTFTCNPANSFGCPSNYKCQISTIANTYVCCQSSTTSVQCPAGWSPYATNGVSRTCTGPTDRSCPAGYSCAQSNLINRFLCCQFVSTNVRCFNGAAAQLTNGRATVCNPSAPSCQGGYSCQASTQTNTFICCQTSSTTLLQCSNGATPFNSNGQNQYCSQPGTNVGCPVNNVCQQSTRAGVYICCSGSTTTNQCPNNLQPYRVNGQPQQCNIFSPNCVAGYTCQRSPTNTNLAYCCEQLRCPGGVTIGTPQSCFAGSTTCTFGQSCVQSSNAPGQYLCCPSGPNTPNAARCIGRSTLIVGSLAQSCQLPNTCAAGYECSSYTTTGQYLCCQVVRGQSPVCPNNRDPYRDANTRQYHYCDNTNFACPDGYVCKRQLNSLDNPNRYVCCSPIPSCQSGWLPYIDPSTRQPKRCSPFQQNMACSPTPGLPYRCQQSTVPNTYLCCMEGARSDANNKDKTKTQMTTRLPIMDNTDTKMIQIEDPNSFRWDNEDTDKEDNNDNKPNDDDDDWVVWNGKP